jgi:inositol transport system substrate-binding protein
MAVAMIGCKGKSPTGSQVFKIGYSNNSDTDTFDKLKRDAFEELVKNDSSVQTIFTNANMDMQAQLDQIDNFIVQNVNMIVMVPVDSAGVIPGIEKANKANIPVICIGTSATGGEYIYPEVWPKSIPTTL